MISNQYILKSKLFVMIVVNLSVVIYGI